MYSVQTVKDCGKRMNAGLHNVTKRGKLEMVTADSLPIRADLLWRHTYTDW